MGTIWRVLTRKKNIDPNDENTGLARVLNTFDLTSLGVGSTLGVGVYVIAGHVAKEVAGPAVVLSFLIAAIASVFAGLCYAEFGARTPRAGSAYIYSYVCVGEFIAFIIGWNLILEYVIGSASVARGLSLYLDTLLNDTLKDTFTDIAPINVSFMSPYFDFFSFGIAILLSVGLAFGMKESSIVNNILTILNIMVVLFVVIAGSIKADAANWNISANETIPDIGDGGFFPFGVSGMLKGAATCFYGFVGFDCIATTGEEVKNPKRAIPVAIICSLAIIFLAYFSTSTVVTMMVPYYLQDVNAPIPHAFAEVGWNVAKWIVAIGAIFGLSASLFGAMFPLPRIIYAMATDGLVFKFLGTVNARFSTPVIGTLLAGFLTGLMSAMFDLKQLVNMMSIGTLLAYTIVAACVLLLRYEEYREMDIKIEDANVNQNETNETYEESVNFSHIITRICNFNRVNTPSKFSENLAAIFVAIYCILALLMGLCAMFLWDEIRLGRIYAIVLTSVVGFLIIIVLMSLSLQPTSARNLTFKVPLVPLIPALSILINIYLMLMLDTNTWIRFGVWMAVGKSYSLNDRLLLSAVVHLTMRETLRELHVRIPSPPPPRKKRHRRPPAKKPLPRYKSPYLFPFTFEPEPLPTGEYKNRCIQYPESIYFSYIDELKREIGENMRCGQEGEEESRNHTKMMEKPYQKNLNFRSITSRSTRPSAHSDLTTEADTFVSTIDKELENELVAAQVKYNALCRRRKAPKLLRPSIYKVCTEASGYIGHLQDTNVSQSAYMDEANTRLSLTVEVRITDEYDENMKRTNTKYQYRVNIEESEMPVDESIDYFSRHTSTFVIGGVVLGRNGEVIPIITGIVPEPETICKCTYKRTPIVSGLSIDDDGKPRKMISGMKLEKIEDRDCICKRKRIAEEREQKRREGEENEKDHITCTCKEKRTPIVSGVTIDGATGKPIRIVSGLKVETDENRVCPCKKKTQEEIQAEIEKSKNNITCTCMERGIPIISGVAVDKWGKRIRVLSGMKVEKIHDKSCLCKGKYAGKEGCHLFEKEKEKIVEERPCTCRPSPPKNNPVRSITDFVAKINDEDPSNAPEKLVEVKALEPFHCHCKDIVERRLKYIKMMKECEGPCNTNKLKPLFILSGMKTEEEGLVPIIAGVKDETCKCMQRYNKRVKRIEDQIAKQRAENALKSTKQKFVIGGVVPGKDGSPTYILSGLAGERHCPKCDALMEERKKEEDRLANMPEFPTGRQKYIISGVQQTPVGNKYILSGAIPIDDCDCMNLYEAYVDRHAKCMQLFEQYMKKVKIDTEEYMSEIGDNWKEVDEEEGEEENEVIQEEPKLEVVSESTSTSTATAASSSDSDVDAYADSCYPCDVPDSDQDDTNILLTLEIGDQKAKKKRNRECECLYRDGSAEQAEIKRFIVLKKIPCDLKEQMKIIKRALKVMALDGYPLAKLPCSYKLPHFKLWMALRCGKYWTMEDRDKLYVLSKKYWNHLDICSTKVKSPKLNISIADAAKYTWGNFKFVKRVTAALNEKYYRKVKQGIIDDGREFYPSTFSYELPTKTFRDCYFAYVPGKEENVFSNRPWSSFEYSDYTLIRKRMQQKRKC